MELPLASFLFLYLIYLAVFLFFTFFNLYHIFRFGFVSFWAYLITIGYIALTGLTLFVSYFYISQVDWTKTFDVLHLNGGLF
jgi:hypothetical protein